jgi:hypothetical protein
MQLVLHAMFGSCSTPLDLRAKGTYYLTLVGKAPGLLGPTTGTDTDAQSRGRSHPQLLCDWSLVT